MCSENINSAEGVWLPSFTRPPLDLLEFYILYHIALLPEWKGGLEAQDLQGFRSVYF